MPMIYELREYVSTPERIDQLDERFEQHVLKFFERHGIEVVAIWRARDDARLVYLTRFADEDSRAAAWESFKADREWLAVKAQSEQDGPLMQDQTTTVLVPTPYSRRP